MSTGLLYMFSLVFLALVVCSVYTLAVDMSVNSSGLMRKFLHRLGRLSGLLAALALVVYFLGLL